jgi:CheY-like chemotaxis protein
MRFIVSSSEKRACGGPVGPSYAKRKFAVPSPVALARHAVATAHFFANGWRIRLRHRRIPRAKGGSMRSNTTLERRPVVLAVDDKRSNLIALDALLGEDYTLLTAGSGAEAISLVRSTVEIDLILMDVQMPEMDGFDTVTHIRLLEVGRDIPIIFVTAVYNEDPFIKRGYEVGAVDYFSKPFDPEVLKKKVAVYANFRTREKLLLERERQLRESEELLRVGRRLSSAVEHLKIGVLVVAPDGRIREHSHDMPGMLRCGAGCASAPYGELIGWWHADGALMADRVTPLGQALQKRMTVHGDPMQIDCPDGSVITIVASASPLHDSDDRVIGAVVLIQDVTERRGIEAALKERVARLVDAGGALQETALDGS